MRTLWLFLVWLGLAESVFGSPVAIEPGRLVIAADESVQPAARDDFLALCRTLGKSLLVGQGVWGEGVFEHASCEGEENNKSAPANWRLKIHVEGQSTEFTLMQRVKTGDKVVEVPEAKRKYDFNLAKLKENKVAEMVAYDLLDALPFSRLITNPHAPSFSHPIKEGAVLPEPSPSYEIFTLRYDGEHRAWIPKVVGKAALTNAPRGEKSG